MDASTKKPATPATEAGRALANDELDVLIWSGGGSDGIDKKAMTKAVLDIEAQAVAPWREALADVLPRIRWTDTNPHNGATLICHGLNEHPPQARCSFCPKVDRLETLLAGEGFRPTPEQQQGYDGDPFMDFAGEGGTE